MFRSCLYLTVVGVYYWAQPAYPQCALDEALRLHQAGDLEHAAQAYGACAAAYPSRYDIRSNFGVVLTALGRYRDAIEQYRAAMQTAPPAVAGRLRFNLALAYYKSSQLSQAAAEFEALHNAAPADNRIALLLADCDLQMGQLAKAIDLLTPLTPVPEQQDALDYMLGMALVRTGRTAEGQIHIDRILRRGDSAEGHFLLGSVLYMNGDFPGAVTEFKRAVALKPALPSLESYYGRALLFTGDADGAAEAFRKELGSNPNDFDANFELAAILSQRGKSSEARPLLERAVQLRPTSAEAKSALEHGFPAPAQVHDGIPKGSAAAPIGSLDFTHLTKPVVLVFGSYTCPKLRYSSSSVKDLWNQFHDLIDFRLVYIREAHAGTDWQSTINQKDGIDLQPARNIAEKREHAELCIRKLSLPFPFVVDSMEGEAENAYRAWPSRVYLISRDGRVAFDSRLGEQDFRAADLGDAIRDVLAKREIHGSAR